MARDLLRIIEELAKDRSISPDVIQLSLEESINKLEKGLHGNDWDIETKIKIFKDDLEIQSYRLLKVIDVNEVENSEVEIALEDAKKIQQDIQSGDFVRQLLPKIEMNRTNLHHLIGIFSNKIQEIQRVYEYEEYKDKIGQMVSGHFKRREGGSVIIDLGKAEAMIPRNELLPPWENFNYNDLVYGYIYDVRSDKKLPQVLMSRTHPQFVVKLFEQEVPEIADGSIQVKAIAREAGSRTKMAVFSNERNISPVGTCIGVRGFRVNAIIKELHGEKIDIINWDPDIATFVINALVPGKVIKVVVNEQRGKIEIIAQEDQLSLIIGSGGQNVRLASKLTGVDIEIMTKEQESEMRDKDLKDSISGLISALDVDEIIAHLLYTEDFCTVDDIISASANELAKIEGFSEDLAQELKLRAEKYKSNEQEIKNMELKNLGVSDDLLNVKHVNYDIAVVLAKNCIKTSEDLANLSIDELIDPNVGFLKDLKIKEKIADEMIMDARSPWFMKQKDDDAI